MSVSAQEKNKGKIARQPRSPLWRLRVWQLIISVGLLVIIGRLYYLQIIKGPDLSRRASLQRQQSNLLVHRGAITDRHGLPLAIDTTRYDVYVHPQLLKVPVSVAISNLARITHQDVDTVERLFSTSLPDHYPGTALNS